MIEKFLAVFTALVAAIEANTAALKGVVASASLPATEPAKPKTKAETKAETKTETVAGPTAKDIADTCQVLLDANGNKSDFIKTLGPKYGVKRLSTVPADKIAEVLNLLNAEIARVKTPVAEDSGI